MMSPAEMGLALMTRDKTSEVKQSEMNVRFESALQRRRMHGETRRVLVGGTFPFAVNAQAICVGLCYANGLSPISAKYGWRYSFIAAIAGLVFAARLNSASPVAGQSFEMDAIASCFIGGASAYGGTGTIGGALIGALIMGVLNNGMSLLGLSTNLQQVVKGLVLLAAVAFDVISKNNLIQLPKLSDLFKSKKAAEIEKA